MITFDASKYDGYIFDCDGTLVDSMPVHFVAWSETLKRKLGRDSDFTESQFYHFGGRPPREIIKQLNDDYGYDLPIDETAHEKEMRFVELMTGVRPIPEVVDVLNRLGTQAKVAVASGGQTEIVRQLLHNVGIEAGPDQTVKVIIGADKVTHGKPNPELFFRAADFLGVKPERCLVFEDAGPGFAAAKAAGMDYIDVRAYRSEMSAAARY